MVNMDDETHPISPNWQWMCCVHVPLPVIARLSVSKDLHLEVPHHGVHHLPARCKNRGKGDIDAASVFLHLMPLKGPNLWVMNHLVSFTCWPFEAVSQAWCRYHSDRHQSWESAPGSDWQGAGWVSPPCRGRDAAEAGTERSVQEGLEGGRERKVMLEDAQ